MRIPRVNKFLVKQVIHILGVGAATPPTIIDNKFLAELLGESVQPICKASGITSRFSSLPLEYLKQTKNRDAFEAKKQSLITPTVLGIQAAQAALAHAGLAAEQIGLVIAECSTPDETTPAEAHRIAGKLGLKIPAFDISSSLGALPLHLDVLAKWSDSRTPEYVLCVSTNCLTQTIDYQQGHEGIFFGDAAAAMVVSRKHAGKLVLRHSVAERTPRSAASWSLDLMSHLKIEGEFESAILDDTRSILQTLLTTAPQTTYFVLPQLSLSLATTFLSEFKLNPERVWNSFPTHGNALGSSPLLTLSQRFPTLKSGDTIAVVSSLGTTIRAGAILEAV